MKRLIILGVTALVGCATTSEPSRQVLEVRALPPAERATPLPAAEEPMAPATVVAPAPVVATLAPVGRAGAQSVVPAPSNFAQPSPAPRLTRAQFVAFNDERLLDVYPGMARRDVERHLWIAYEGKPWNPFKRETIRDHGGKRYDVVFYLTREPVPGKAITETQLTPVVFDGDRVHSVGRYPLKKLRKAACENRCS
jgi:hypothetical protein